MAETELSVLSAQCLNRRLADMAAMQAEKTTWQGERNNWQFTTSDARIRLKRLYPIF